MYRTLSFLILLFVSSISYAQELPPIKIFTPENYKAQNQNWGIAQSEDDLIYVANNGGLLEYNGEHWQLYTHYSNPILRSLKIKGKVIYTGSFMDFGFWEKNEKGQLKYSSLVVDFKIKLKEGEEFWKVDFYQDWILFQSKTRIYFVNKITKEVKIIDSNETISGLFVINNTIFFQKKNIGVFTLENGEEKMFSGVDFFKNNKIINCFYQNKELVFLSEENGFATVKEHNVVLRTSDLNKGKFSVFSAIQLKDDSFVLGTISNGIIFLNSKGEITSTINRKNGLSNNTALSLFQDKTDNIWIGLDNGINCINISSAFKIFEDEDGALGTVYSSFFFDNELYLGTNQGLFFKDKDLKYKIIKGTEGQVWFLKEIDGILFCGHDKGTFIIKDKKVINIIAEQLGTWNIKKVPNNTDILIQGTYQGLSILEKKNGVWRFRNKIDGFNISSRFYEFYKDKLYVNHELKGFYELKIDENYSKVLHQKKVNIPEEGYGSNVFTFSNNLFYASSKGIFKKLPNGNFSKDTLFTNVLNNIENITTIRKLPEKKNTFYSFSNNNILFITSNSVSLKPQVKRIPIAGAIRNNVLGFENLTQISENNYLIGTSHGYLLLNDAIEKSEQEVAISLQYVLVHKIDGIKTNLSLEGEIELENKQNNIDFSYSISKYDKIIKNEYQYQLKGLSSTWSAWSENSSQLFENLPYGDYVFNVKGKYGNQVTKMESFSFSIERPYYLSNLFFVFYTLSVVFIIVMINIYYRRRYKRKNKILLEKAQKELKLKELENSQIIMKLNNEKLRVDIDSKSRELASSTMNIIKKNDFLNTIKTELINGDSKNILKVIKIIDKNLNNSDDWKMFQEAFNNADKNFLKKVKDKHVNLTPNDLRLCAYLRLNLSSKEIAPLLNISPRSVEVKRYRLRKKMDLPHDSNLTNYILEI
ncbi:helix-turn-helix and ligand-binding sensor domain-containing protein [Polaribacter sp. L3A8]|uniref:helix-turn-helix and ligand-binding sensor domain-containing protein n=1 Tax=Polaribacter sp. L3A8 TaxID=2686361 RepID=UPI00131E75BF|nr:triple tyrosine motif-containing protein [Polaribacter sp. L3A8]